MGDATSSLGDVQVAADVWGMMTRSKRDSKEEQEAVRPLPPCPLRWNDANAFLPGL
jgi:hypothetical protein